MSELSFEQMLEDSVKTIRNGEIVQGTVIDVKEDEIILNIGYKADGIDTMLVVGGRHSSNTQKLFEICKKECGNTYYIQTPVDLDSEMFQCSSCVGITAGASTPKKIIEEVQEHVRIKF